MPNHVTHPEFDDVRACSTWLVRIRQPRQEPVWSLHRPQESGEMTRDLETVGDAR